MKPWQETLPVEKPFREVRLIRYGPASEVWELCLQEQEQIGFERGRQEGERALSEQLIRQRSELHELQNGVLRSLMDVLPQVVHEAETILIEVALEAARKLVSDLPVNAEMVEAVVRQALAQTEQSSGLKVFLNPDDLALLQQVKSPLLGPNSPEGRLEFAASREVTRGGCMVQTSFGLLDARRETKFKLIRENLPL
jgi:flagellar assembly protein FliH